MVSERCARQEKSGRVKGFWGERARCCNGDLTIEALAWPGRLQGPKFFFSLDSQPKRGYTGRRRKSEDEAAMLPSETARPEIRVGPAGWSYQDWKRVVYPDARPRNFHEAAYLARYFDTIEINTSFYRPLRPELARLWVRKVEFNPRFRFTAKLHRVFTHEGRLEAADVEQFREGLAPLAEARRLGCVLMQFPVSFRFNRESRDYLVQLKKTFPEYPLVAEMRHDSWSADEAI